MCRNYCPRIMKDVQITSLHMKIIPKWIWHIYFLCKLTKSFRTSIMTLCSCLEMKFCFQIPDTITSQLVFTFGIWQCFSVCRVWWDLWMSQNCCHWRMKKEVQNSWSSDMNRIVSSRHKNARRQKRASFFYQFIFDLPIISGQGYTSVSLVNDRCLKTGHNCTSRRFCSRDSSRRRFIPYATWRVTE